MLMYRFSVPDKGFGPLQGEVCHHLEAFGQSLVTNPDNDSVVYHLFLEVSECAGFHEVVQTGDKLFY